MTTSDTEDVQFYDALSNDDSDSDGMIIDVEYKTSQGEQGALSGHVNEYPKVKIQMHDIPAYGRASPMEIQEDTPIHTTEAAPSGASSSGIFDLVDSVPGLYRVLDLVHDKGSGGLVDKIIIKQDSLGRLINEFCPGAYTSITKVDFSTLDSVRVKPIGLYGSKSAIVEFLLKRKVVSEKTAPAMLQVINSPGLMQPSLSSGMYILLRKPGEAMYVIYWPEDTTWNDNCASSVCKNRVTFMRYLTKIADQVVCLMSDEHAEAMVWRGEALDSEQDSIDDEDSDRLFAFEVSKTNEQEEGVTSRPGFEISLNPSVIRPRLVRGEMQQGFVTAQYVSEERRLHHVSDTQTEARVKHLLERYAIRLHEDLSADALDLLLKLGLRHEAGNALRKYRKDVLEVKQSARESLTQDLDTSVSRIDAEDVHLSVSLEETLMAGVLLRFPILAREGPQTSADGQGSKEAMSVDDDYISKLCSMYDEVAPMVRNAHEHAGLKGVNIDRYKTSKVRILTLDHILGLDLDMNAEEMDGLIASTLEEGYSGKLPSRGAASLFSRFTGFLTGSDSSPLPQAIQVPQSVLKVSDQDFLARLPMIVERYAQLSDAAAEAAEYAHKSEETRQLEDLRAGILRTLNANLQRGPSQRTITIQQLEVEATSWHNEQTHPKYYTIAMIEETCVDPLMRYMIHPIELKEGDAHRMQEDDSYLPAPQVHSHSASTFSLPVDMTLVYVHLLPKSHCILVTRDRTGEARVYVSSTTHLSHALDRRPAKQLKRDKIGEKLLLAYDESKRILAVCGMSGAGPEARFELHTFRFDESYTSLQGVGAPIVLSSWYDTPVTITHMEFVNSEELVFVDNDSRARVYSLVAQRFRPAALRLQKKPSSVHSTPDGSCLFVVEEPEDETAGATLRAYHWSSFGSSEGIKIDIPQTFAGDCVVTSLLANTNVHLLGLDLSAKTLRSLKFTITSRITEFTFKKKGKLIASRKEQATQHNSLVDCHAEVWTRFPVVPAVRRETVVSTLRERRVLVFVSNVDPKPFAPHFSALIDDFERVTRKPTGDELKNIHVLALDHALFLTECPIIPSTFRAGEWLVEILCLIPIHIAVTRDNRFVPLKDGVWSPDLERSLLGADVAKIIDSISFGWYESLFQSYMATKPVKVVSSMGEQSVGKSFALNHLVDTSFAGSAMRTTEGVWMSVTPTDDVLIVALDFEGVHSIERSAQEDTLLVLFNTAISNLVLFRNNFALSREITGLFQSFQSSASVLDPEANPMLFQSTLVIVIKDVVDSDKNDITKEFYLKFQQIVQAEQAMNFISRLHRNRLDIVPWPVIESKQFYTLFKTIKKRLDQQPVTHQGGSVFLQTMKTLMAKLKANDWGAMSQNLAAHRTHLLLSLLPKALAFGAAEVIPDFEPLTNFDTAAVIEAEDSISRDVFSVRLLYLLERHRIPAITHMTLARNLSTSARKDCGYFCTLPLGHTQKEHDTSHGSMSKTRWAIDGPDGTILEDVMPMLTGAAPMMVQRMIAVALIMSTLSRPWNRNLVERKTGSRMPYIGGAQDSRTHTLKKIRSTLPNGPEHDTQPSYCILPIFHGLPQALAVGSPGNVGYISSHGHEFACPNPVVLGQAFHVIFVVDRSSSMRRNDRLPLEDTPTTRIIRQTHNNRLGAVYSSLQGFWEARHHSLVTNGGAGRRDAYTVVLFDDGVARAVSNDFSGSPAELLNTVLGYRPRRGTNFTLAMQTAQQCMEEYWSTERSPVIIFLSDGECSSPDRAMQDVCRRSVALGKPLSFHAVAFGPYSGVLQRMAQIAQDVENRAPQDAVNLQNHVPSAYHEALNTVRLAETFLGIADSLSKPRGALFRG
ncbi:hypothetical protein LXA43DRAFT_1153915 [Ganoderma leucocontextum]|nr:hypothetical protein LXA43DRAFT_1153915 [Ganoderma leucocontextum]